MSIEKHVYCGGISLVRGEMAIRASQVNLTFTTDSSVTGKGFKLSYQINLISGEKLDIYSAECQKCCMAYIVYQ